MENKAIKNMSGKRIKECLDRNGIKYSYLSEKTGIPMNILSPLLNGKREVKATEYFAICEALNVTLEKFAYDVRTLEPSTAG